MRSFAPHKSSLFDFWKFLGEIFGENGNFGPKCVKIAENVENWPKNDQRLENFFEPKMIPDHRGVGKTMFNDVFEPQSVISGPSWSTFTVKKADFGGKKCSKVGLKTRIFKVSPIDREWFPTVKNGYNRSKNVLPAAQSTQRAVEVRWAGMCYMHAQRNSTALSEKTGRRSIGRWWMLVYPVPRKELLTRFSLYQYSNNANHCSQNTGCAM